MLLLSRNIYISLSGVSCSTGITSSGLPRAERLPEISVAAPCLTFLLGCWTNGPMLDLSCVESDKATRLFAWRRPVVASAMPKLPQGKNFGAGDAIPEVRCNDMEENVQICSDNQSEVRTGSWNWFNYCLQSTTQQTVERSIATVIGVNSTKLSAFRMSFSKSL